jgi:hypothetical protein
MLWYSCCFFSETASLLFCITNVLSSMLWQALVDLFLKDLYRLYSLPPESLLVVHLQAGLSALKTPHCYQVCQKKHVLLGSE